MKRIPSSFKVMGHTIRVRVIVRDKWPHPDCVAIFEPDRNRISVQKMSAAMTRQAFWHEAMHAMLHAFNHPLYNDEAFVDNMGGLLAQLMETAQ